MTDYGTRLTDYRTRLTDYGTRICIPIPQSVILVPQSIVWNSLALGLRAELQIGYSPGSGNGS